jgi:hypothetical protein
MQVLALRDAEMRIARRNAANIVAAATIAEIAASHTSTVSLVTLRLPRLGRRSLCKCRAFESQLDLLGERR